MLISYKLGQASVVLRVKLVNSSLTTGAGLTGLTEASAGLIIATIANNEAATTRYRASSSEVETIATLGTYAAPSSGKCRFKEVDATNHPGLYEIQLENARFSVASAKELTVSIHGATNLAQQDFVVPLTSFDPYDPVRAGLTCLPNVNNGTTGGLLVHGSGTTGLNTTSGKAPATVAAGDLADSSITSTTFAVNTGMRPLHTGTLQAGSGTTATLAAGAASTNSYYNNALFVITGGTGLGQTPRIITAYNGTTKVATLADTLQTSLDNTTTYAIVPRGPSATMAWDGVETVNQAGRPAVALVQINSSNDAVTGLEYFFNAGNKNHVGLTQSGSTASTVVLPAAFQATDDYFNGSLIRLTGVQNGTGQTRRIIDYDGTTKVATIAPDWLVTPGANVDFAIISDGIASVLNANGNMPSNVLEISDDAVAADNLEAMLDGTGGVNLDVDQFNAVNVSVSSNLTAGNFAAANVTLGAGDAALIIESGDPTIYIGSLAVDAFSCAGNFAVAGAVSCNGFVDTSYFLVDGVTTLSGAFTATHASNDIRGIQTATFAGAAATAISDINDVVTDATFGNSALNDDLDTLLGRLTNSRAGYLDNLNVGGPVASQADVAAINASSSRRITLATVGLYELPGAGDTEVYTVEARTYDAAGAPVNADTTPTLTVTGAESGDLSANLSAATNPATGLYRWTYSVEDDAALEEILYAVSADIDSDTFTMSALTQTSDIVGATFTTTDQDHLTAIFDKLPSRDFLLGTSASTGAIVTADIGLATPNLDTQLTAIVADTNELQTDWANGGRLDNILDARASQATADAIVADTNELQTDWANGGRLDLIVDATLADTNELQTDWTDGGRLDLILDARAAQTDMTTMLGRLTNARAGYLDNLNVGGPVASQADVAAINASSSRHITMVTVGQYERPETGDSDYTVEARTFDAVGAPVNADTDPTLTATGGISGNLSANLSAVANPATGVYRWAYTVDDTATIEEVRFDISADIDSDTFTLGVLTQITDVVAATFTATDQTHLTAIFNKLPSRTYIGGSSQSTGSIDAADKTGFALTSAYDPAKTASQAGDAMALTSGERTTLVAVAWNALTSGMVTVGSIGKRIVDFLTGDAFTRLGAPTGASIAADLNKVSYFATIDFRRTTTGDEYSVDWYRVSQQVTAPVSSGVTSPLIKVMRRSNGSDLVASTAMSTVGTGFKYDEATNLVVPGEAARVEVTATIDGSPRTWTRWIGRDNA